MSPVTYMSVILFAGNQHNFRWQGCAYSNSVAIFLYNLLYNLNIHTLALQISKDSLQKRKAIITPVNSTTITSSVSSLAVKKELKQCFRQTMARKMEAKKLWEDWPSTVSTLCTRSVQKNFIVLFFPLCCATKSSNKTNRINGSADVTITIIFSIYRITLSHFDKD
uniref:Uncharacterized protein n=1 Tax=Glossina pallidipes TaxID=7398 RepID=A0A1A9ZE72_GLOPL